ncbi:MAG: RsmB/NOP family class I SAM-dependent RNA methyltransferase [Alphaproteobacteria bacterium]|nr:RsmB/NOP family class I SAM-dependent RNA methyltransferase [Alphaproteobacteria bacterium]
MIESARVQAAIEILEQVSESLSNDGPSADNLIRKYFRTRRYAGSKDRRAVTGLVYQVVRNWGFLAEVSGGSVRKMVLLTLGDDALFNGQDHAPAAPSDDERAFLTETHEEQPHHRLNYPLWLESRLQARFGDNFAAELESLNGRAPFDLRVNLGKSTVAEVETFLKDQGVDFSRGKWADSALILSDNPRIDAWDIYKDGAVEIQDEAAQLAVDLCAIKPGQQVMDLCAGAGGKTLAAAALMDNKGQIYAFDNNARRLKDLKPRAKRANVRILQGRHLDTAGGKRQKILSEYLEKMDRVILDVPCSGSGVWRRNPELKWRLDADNLTKYMRIQKTLLSEGWGFVKPGGRMIYMTCSLFQDENEHQVSTFLDGHEGAKLIPYSDLYEKPDLETLSSLPDCLALSPHSHGTDGFFVAIIEKTA